MSNHIINATDTSFATEVLQSSQLVLVDFWAEWCGPCKALAPVLHDIADEHSDTIKVVKVNVDQAPETATNYSIRSIPTLLLFKAGEIVASHIGGMSKVQLQNFIAEHA